MFSKSENQFKLLKTEYNCILVNLSEILQTHPVFSRKSAIFFKEIFALYEGTLIEKGNIYKKEKDFFDLCIKNRRMLSKNLTQLLKYISLELKSSNKHNYNIKDIDLIADIELQLVKLQGKLVTANIQEQEKLEMLIEEYSNTLNDLFENVSKVLKEHYRVYNENSRDDFSIFSAEIMLNILSRIPAKDCGRLTRLNKWWHHFISNEDTLWKNLYQDEFNKENIVSNNEGKYKDKYVKQYLATKELYIPFQTPLRTQRYPGTRVLKDIWEFEHFKQRFINSDPSWKYIYSTEGEASAIIYGWTINNYVPGIMKISIPQGMIIDAKRNRSQLINIENIDSYIEFVMYQENGQKILISNPHFKGQKQEFNNDTNNNNQLSP